MSIGRFLTNAERTAYYEGRKAFRMGKNTSNNPYNPSIQNLLFHQCFMGWMSQHVKSHMKRSIKKSNQLSLDLQ